MICVPRGVCAPIGRRLMTALRQERSFIDNHHLRSKYFRTCDQGSEPPLDDGNESSDDFRCTPDSGHRRPSRPCPKSANSGSRSRGLLDRWCRETRRCVTLEVLLCGGRRYRSEVAIGRQAIQKCENRVQRARRRLRRSAISTTLDIARACGPRARAQRLVPEVHADGSEP